MAIEFEARLNEAEKLHKTLKYSIFDEDLSQVDKNKMTYKVLT